MASLSSLSHKAEARGGGINWILFQGSPLLPGRFASKQPDSSGQILDPALTDNFAILQSRCFE